MGTLELAIFSQVGTSDATRATWLSEVAREEPRSRRHIVFRSAATLTALSLPSLSNLTPAVGRAKSGRQATAMSIKMKTRRRALASIASFTTSSVGVRNGG